MGEIKILALCSAKLSQMLKWDFQNLPHLVKTEISYSSLVFPLVYFTDLTHVWLEPIRFECSMAGLVLLKITKTRFVERPTQIERQFYKNLLIRH